MSEPNPQMHAEIEKMVRNLEKDADLLNAEMKLRLAAAPARMEMDAEFTYRVFFLTAMNRRLQPLVSERTLLKMAIFDIIGLELAGEQQARMA